MQNNLAHAREQLHKADGDCLTAGFEYSVQNGGVVFGEKRWSELGRQKHTCFQLCRADGRNGEANQLDRRKPTINSVASMVQSASQEYQRRRSLPPAPPPPPPPKPRPLPNSSNNCNLLSQPTPNQNRGNGVIGESTSREIGEPSHAAARNQYAATAAHVSSKPPPPPPGSMGPPPARPLAPLVSQLAMNEGEEDDDDFDALIASVDVDEMVSHRDSAFGSDTSGHHNNSNNNNQSFQRQSTSSFENVRGRGMDQIQTYQNSYSTGTGSLDSSFQSDTSFPLSARSSDPGSNNFFDQSTHSTFGESASNGFQTDNLGAPCCAGHNQPCILLTANTEANAGRQFYKCSLPEGQKCDFFEWADGMDGNLHSYDGDGMGSEPGDIKDMLTENQRKFGHRNFRAGQRDIIANAIKGQDVFVLMPTGGGKSLCYQLPAWCCPGLAVVISPLLSLIQDQVQSLIKLGVDAVFLASCQDYETEQVEINRRLRETTGHGGVKMLYITPEKLTNSTHMQSLLRRLYDKGLISRFVIDEAHCMSDWAHDFRKDYGRLGQLRQWFPRVPLMALTATANDRVVNDAIRALGMRNEYRYKSSFNRPNLHYEVRKKGSKTIEEIADYVAERPNDSGVVYCLSRKDCEKVSKEIQEKVRKKPGCSRIRVSFYHAEVDPHERERRHLEWSNGKVSVLCATVAFGMGIDKPDVRYVIHYSMPKSITHYYQESGRAGRDGEIADCILYYTYKDKGTLENLIVKNATNPNSAGTRRQVDQLYSCVRYCEDFSRCRRTLQLEYFNEKFPRSQCQSTCDNCKAGRTPEVRDLSGVANQMLTLLENTKQQKRNGVTLNQLCELFRGSKSKAATNHVDTSRLRLYGAGKSLKKHEVERISRKMVLDRVLMEASVQNQQGFLNEYVEWGEEATAIQNGSKKFMVEFPKEAAKPGGGKENRQAKKKQGAKKKAATGAKGRNNKAEKKQSQTHTNAIINLDSDSSDDDMSAIKSAPPASKSALPDTTTKALIDRIKTLALNWAEEDRMMGKNTYYWNILSNEAMKNIAAKTPTTIEELEGIGSLGEAIIRDYGERIVKVVRIYLSEKGVSPTKDKGSAKRSLDESTNASSKRKKPGQQLVVSLNDDDDEAEFKGETEVIEIPDSTPSVQDKSKFF